jgi:hypothetical protein
LDDVDASLAAMLTRQLPDGTTVSFEAPSPAWADAPPGKQVVNAFLYDIREEREGRGADWEDVRDEHGRVIGRQPPPRRYELSYLVTAWAGDAALEHRLLSDVLRMAFGGEAVPADCRVGSLAETGLPMLLRVVRQDPPHAPSQVWSDLGLPPRLVVDVAVTAPLVPALVTDLAPPAEDMRLGIGRGGPGTFRKTGPPGPQRPDAAGMPVATPDQQWRHRMVDEREEAPGTGAGEAGAGGTGGGGAGATAGGGGAGSGAAGSGAGGSQVKLRRRITTTKKD